MSFRANLFFRLLTKQWGSIESNGILAKLVHLQTERRFVQRGDKLLAVRRRKVLLYVVLQVGGVAACVAVSHTLAAIGFPVLIILLIPVRTFLAPRWFSLRELRVLDEFTATSSVVLASLGGKPELPESSGMEGELERAREKEQRGARRQRVGSITR